MTTRFALIVSTTFLSFLIKNSHHYINQKIEKLLKFGFTTAMLQFGPENLIFSGGGNLVQDPSLNNGFKPL